MNGEKGLHNANGVRHAGMSLITAVLALGGLCSLIVTVSLAIFTGKVEDNVRSQINSLKAELTGRGSPLVTDAEFQARLQSAEQMRTNMQHRIDELKTEMARDRELIEVLKNQVSDLKRNRQPEK